MIDRNELGIRLKVAIELNNRFYLNHALGNMLNPKSAKTLALLAEIEAINGERRLLQKRIYIYQQLAHRILTSEKVKEKSCSLPAALGITVQQKIIDSLPTAHKLVAAKNYAELGLVLDMMLAISNGAVVIDASDHNFDKVDILGQNLLHIAAHNNDVAAFIALMESNVIQAEDCLSEDIQCLTPLQIILHHTQDPSNNTRYKALAILRKLVEKGWLKINEPLLGNLTLMHYAAMTNNTFLCRSLFTLLGADVNVVNSVDGNTPLHYACQKNCKEVVELLLAADKNENCKTMTMINKAQETPLHCAQNYGAKDVVHYLNSIRKNQELTQYASLNTGNNAQPLSFSYNSGSILERQLSKQDTRQREVSRLTRAQSLPNLSKSEEGTKKQEQGSKATRL